MKSLNIANEINSNFFKNAFFILPTIVKKWKILKKWRIELTKRINSIILFVLGKA